MTGIAKLKPMPDATLRQRVVTRLKNLIVAGELSPGQRLTETELASALNISRGPLREAIRELVDTGLLTSQPYKGLFVRSVNRDDLEEIYSLRTALEQLAMRQCWHRRTSVACEELKDLRRQLVKAVDLGTDPMMAIEQELALHQWCYVLSGHKLLLGAWERLKPNLQFYFTLHQRAHQRSGPMRDAHDTYVQLACGDDLGAMLNHLEDHMRQGLATTLEFIDETST